MLLYMATCPRGAFELHSRAGLVRHALDISPPEDCWLAFPSSNYTSTKCVVYSLVVPTIVYLLSSLSIKDGYTTTQVL